jgi:hypothetical protein
VRLANGSVVLLALGAVPAFEVVPALEVVLLPQAATARQLTPAAAANVIRTKPGRPSNIIISDQGAPRRDILAQTVGGLNGYCGITEEMRPN